MDLPKPSPSDAIVASLDAIAGSAANWHDISAGLLSIERETGDVQACWLMTAFDYHLARRVGEERDRRDAFGTNVPASAQTFPTPLDRVPTEVIELWANTVERVTAPAARARLNHELGRPDDVAWAALFLASDESSFVLGTGLVIDGGVTGGK